MNCSYGYMIDNIILLLIGTLHNRPIAELLHKCHPLGSFAQMEAVTIATTVEELYSAVLIDTPIGTVLFFYHATLPRGEVCAAAILAVHWDVLTIEFVSYETCQSKYSGSVAQRGCGRQINPQCRRV